jgi:hypothetical protein
LEKIFSPLAGEATPHMSNQASRQVHPGHANCFRQSVIAINRTRESRGASTMVMDETTSS